jgi:hypothetical protein
MLELQSEGQVRALGVSNFDVEMLDRCEAGTRDRSPRPALGRRADDAVHRDLLDSEIGLRVQLGRLQDMAERCQPTRSPGQDRPDATPNARYRAAWNSSRARMCPYRCERYNSAASVVESKRCSVRVSSPSFTSSPTLTSMRGSTRAVILASPTRP